jgi:antitoxin ParD1/3/4
MDLTALPDEVKDLVRAQIEAGRFQSVDEVVVEALRLLQEREELFASHRDELRAQIAEGVAAEARGELRDGDGLAEGLCIMGPPPGPCLPPGIIASPAGCIMPPDIIEAVAMG